MAKSTIMGFLSIKSCMDQDLLYKDKRTLGMSAEETINNQDYCFDCKVMATVWTIFIQSADAPDVMQHPFLVISGEK